MVQGEEIHITLRQARVLAAIVRENCETGEPVGSHEIEERYHLEVSAATIRNEMQALEKEGLITQPHTSAVNQLMDKVKLSMKEQERLRHELIKLQMTHMEMGRRLVKIMADQSQQASFAIFPEQVSTVGLSNILDNPALPAEDAREIAKFFDDIDSFAEKMIEEYGDRPAEAVIGKEVKLSKKSDYSMIVSGLKLPSGKKGVIGLIGPKSMKYDKNMSLLEYITKLLGGSSAVIFFILTR
jgi:transcriptional regulator of heat shock response